MRCLIIQNKKKIVSDKSNRMDQARSICRVKEEKRTIISRYARGNDIRALIQVLIALALLALVWWVAVTSAGIFNWLTVLPVLLISLFTVRVFVLMHECGHGSLFRTQRLNRAFGFILGVVAGMPQYVWSRHHAYHHAHNGDWDKYRGLYLRITWKRALQ